MSWLTGPYGGLSSMQFDRVSPYGGHKLRVLLRDCAVRCFFLLTLVTILVSILLHSYRFPITAGLQSQLPAQELSELPRSVAASEASTHDTLQDANDALIAEEPPSFEQLQEPKRIQLQKNVLQEENVLTGMAVTGQTARDACTTLSIATRDKPVPVVDQQKRPPCTTHSMTSHRDCHYVKTVLCLETKYCSNCHSSHPADHFKGNRTRLFATCSTCRDRGSRDREEAPLCWP